MSQPPSIRIKAQDLQVFEPTRLGSRSSEFRRLIGQFSNQKQSAIIEMIETVAHEVLSSEDDDPEALALAVTLLVLRDYITAGYYPIESQGSLYLARVIDSDSLSDADYRVMLQKQYEAARGRALRDRGQLKWLRNALREIQDGHYRPHEMLTYLRSGPPQTVLLDTRSDADGLDVRRLWRCVRATWSMGPEASAPGREVAFVVADVRAPSTPLGILQFRNVVPEIRMRDLWLGSAVGTSSPPSGFLGHLGHGKGADDRIWATHRLLSTLLSHLNRDGLPSNLTAAEIPLLAELMQTSRLLFDETRRDGGPQGLNNEHLRILKRAQTAHDLLRGITALERLAAEPQKIDEDKGLLADLDAGLTKIWHYHMGFVAIEMSICGAAPPFGPMRVGKLIAALAGSAPVLDAWGWDRPLGQISQEVYLPTVREAVPNPGPLVVFTSGLYPGHSAQYTRVESGASRWKKIGDTMGFGGFHISFETTEALRRLNDLVDGYQHVTRTFGEGSGARFRSAGRGLSYLGLPDLRKHETKRPLYALPLVENPREALLGWEPPRRLPTSTPQEIGEAWWNRWVRSRGDELGDQAKAVPDLEGTLARITESHL